MHHLNNLETPSPKKDRSVPFSADDLDEIACVIEDSIPTEDEAGPAGVAAWAYVHELVIAEARRMREASQHLAKRRELDVDAAWARTDARNDKRSSEAAMPIKSAAENVMENLTTRAVPSESETNP